MKLLNRIKEINYRHYICVAICAALLLISIFCFSEAYFRFVESLKDLWHSVSFVFCAIFRINNSIAAPGVSDLSNVIDVSNLVPVTFDSFKNRVVTFGEAFISSDNFFVYVGKIKDFVIIILLVVMILIPLIIIISKLLSQYFTKQNNNYNKDSFCLKVWRKVSAVTVKPAVKWFSGFRDFVNENSIYKKICLVIVLFSLNVGAIIVSFFAFYFYFMVTFDFAGIFTQLAKLALDLSLFFRVPLYVWLPVIICLICYWRKNAGYRRLNRYEARNQVFISGLPICILIKGVMNAGKTKFLTDIGISLENIFREKAKELMFKNDLKFPDFPWVNFERELDRAICYGEIFNLVSCREFVRKKASRFEKNKCREKLFDYDYENYGMEFDDNLKINNLFDVLETYAQLYYIYIMETPLVVSNYSTRFDNALIDAGNFPEWDFRIFEKTSSESAENTRYSHILDYDMLRLGRKVGKCNEYANAFEFGIVLLTEGGKERGNQYDTNEDKRKTDETNRKNDMFNQYLKLIRSASTVDYTPFVRVFMDEQRYQSLNADNRELCNIIDIKNVSEKRLAMPCFWLEALAYDIVFDRFFSAYYKYRFNRADNTLFLHFLKFVVSKINNHYDRIFNTFGYEKYKVESQRGDLEGDAKKHEYYLMSKKIYSNRYCTDVFGGYFEAKAKKSDYGLDDIPMYTGLRATDEEIKQQHSFFFNELETYTTDDEANNAEYLKRREAEQEAERIKLETERRLKEDAK